VTTPFTTTLRASGATLQVGPVGGTRLTFRVQIPEIWDVLRVEASADTSVALVKERALERLMPDAGEPDEYLVKFGGWEVLDESVSLAASGVLAGSTLLVSGRRRRPVR
jgi:hypothetical protein